MSLTKMKGDLAEAIIKSDILKQGYKVAVPFGEDWRYDLIAEIEDNLVRIQCKYTESDGEVINAYCRSTNNWNTIKYISSMIDYMAIYDKTTNLCYYIPASELGDGKALLKLRLLPAKNNIQKNIRWAKDYLALKALR